MGLRYKAGAMGVPFLPSLTMLGSDLAGTLGLRTVDCPYTGEQLAAVPALNPDVALIHAHRADMFGNVQVDGYRHMDADIAKAARTVIVSAERIVSPEEIAASPAQTMLPHFAVDAVVAAPHGSYPHECYGLYGPDFEHFTAYATATKDKGRPGPCVMSRRTSTARPASPGLSRRPARSGWRRWRRTRGTDGAMTAAGVAR
jgi:Acyl CoA:acetate/3-ketoacid CoA transferase, alpha subunit